jgi:hypothetical protein
MKNVRQAFEKWEKQEGDLQPGYKKIRCHFVYDIKLDENFRRKARLVADGNYVKGLSAHCPIGSFVGQLTTSCLRSNVYLTADCREKIYIIAGPEFGS